MGEVRGNSQQEIPFSFCLDPVFKVVAMLLCLVKKDNVTSKGLAHLLISWCDQEVCFIIWHQFINYFKNIKVQIYCFKDKFSMVIIVSITKIFEVSKYEKKLIETNLLFKSILTITKTEYVTIKISILSYLNNYISGAS